MDIKENCLFLLFLFAGKGRRAITNLKQSANKLARRVLDLHKQAGIAVDPQRSYTIKDAEDFQIHWEGRYQIIIVSSTTLNMPVFTGKFTLVLF
jgi:hypothetical protein